MNDSAVFTARLFVALTATILSIFYTFQMSQGRCNIHPLYVQLVTAVVYTLSSFGFDDFVFTTVLFADGTQVKVSIARYLFWVMTCPVILAGYIQLLHYMPTVQHDYIRTTFIIVKDIITMCFGILAAVQPAGTLKIIFLIISFIFSFWLIIDMFFLLRERAIDFSERRLWIWLQVTSWLMLSSWMIFPLLFIIGPPGFSAISEGGDAVGHAVGDLIAKNIFGFSVWYFRYYIVFPHRDRVMKEMAIKNPAMVSAAIVPADRNSKKKVSSVTAPPVGTILVVEREPHIQRLIEYLTQDANVNVEFAFDNDQARRILDRCRLDQFSCVFINLSDALNMDPHEMEEAKVHFSAEPFCMPVVGYTFDYSDTVQDHEIALFCHARVAHMIDPRHLAEIVEHWGRTAKLWRERSRAEREEQKQFAGVPRSARSGGDDGMSHIGDQSRTMLTRRNSFASEVTNGGHFPGKLYLAQQPHSRPPANSFSFAQQDVTSPGSVPDMSNYQQSMNDTCCAFGCDRAAELKCSNCHKVQYCSRDCQVRHWRNGHKQECK
eukprot:CAMPEP_0202077520 /NCGR_PEP_ID=MMETSP0964-20121228/5424_1 /ASSEMBLY_ACC=CAM_ASM_000500 /TAXON_ID=4773 /ORGANISM="Schizochytrium aggregatum, Strain ATCC28209" /LENGTH=546 /DNA_ID=CAMNT_0048644801 /DNA_START=46 /DNA_END=1686 /DNA_ORIENTATION=-